MERIRESVIEWLLGHGTSIVITVVVAVLARVVAGAIVRRLFARWTKSQDSEMKKRSDTLSGLVANVVSTTIFVTAVVMVLSELGVDVGPVLAAAGIVGVAIGFGSQQLVQDVISGFFILLEDQVRVGDVIQTAGHSGLVEKVTLRTIKLRDLSGNVHYVRNGRVDVVSNMTKDYSFYVFDIGVSYREDVDEVVEVIKHVDQQLREDAAFASDILEPIEVLGLDQFAESAVVIKARIKTKPIQQWRVGREFNRRLKIAFDARNIEIPFPHVTVYVGQDKQGNAPALPVNLRERAGAG